jgi:hypothetical protein
MMTTRPDGTKETIENVLDRIDLMREELTAIQQSLEHLLAAKGRTSENDSKE